MESATPIRHDPSSAHASRDLDLDESLGRGHEQRDTYVKPILVFIAVLAISIVVVQFAVWWLGKILDYQNTMADPRASSSVSQQSISQSLVGHVPPPEPRLQPSPFHESHDSEDMANLQSRWDTELSTFGKFADEKDRVHVPVERMIQQAAEKGIDSVKPKATTAPAK